MTEEKEWTKETLVKFLKPKHSLLAEFATALIGDETYGEEEAAALLTENGTVRILVTSLATT